MTKRNDEISGLVTKLPHILEQLLPTGGIAVLVIVADVSKNESSPTFMMTSNVMSDAGRLALLETGIRKIRQGASEQFIIETAPRENN
jgi:hypothetical protein